MCILVTHILPTMTNATFQGGGQILNLHWALAAHFIS